MDRELWHTVKKGNVTQTIESEIPEKYLTKMNELKWDPELGELSGFFAKKFTNNPRPRILAYGRQVGKHGVYYIFAYFPDHTTYERSLKHLTTNLQKRLMWATAFGNCLAPLYIR